MKRGLNIRNSQGSILGVTLIIFAVLMMLGTFTLSLAVNDNRQAMHHQNKTQAYYIARSGAEAVEAAILTLEDNGEKEKLLDSLAENTKDIEIDKMEFSKGKLEYVRLKKDNDRLLIESKGTVGKISEITRKVIPINLIKGGEGSETIKITNSIFAEDSIILRSIKEDGGYNAIGGISGNIESNGTIELFTNGSSPQISGSITSYENKNILVNGSSYYNINKWISNNENRMKKTNEITKYQTPIFPEQEFHEISGVPEIKEFNTNLPKTQCLPGTTIDGDVYFQTIDLKWNEFIQIKADKDINIYVDEFKLAGGNNFQLRVIGDKDVNIFVKDRFESKSKPISAVNNPTINLYYYGNSHEFNLGHHVENIPININIYSRDKGGEISFNRIKGDINVIDSGFRLSDGEIVGNIWMKNGYVKIGGSSTLKGNIYNSLGDIQIKGSAKIDGDILAKEGNIELIGNGNVYNGNIYIKNGDITFEGSSSLNGNIISSATNKNIILDGGGSTINGIIYSPKSDIFFYSSSKVNGAIVSNKIEVANWAATINYTQSNIDTSIIQTESSIPSEIIFIDSYYIK